jgi:membrane-bound metal-dependent hydrolase YbcI (DUF457 family)
MFIGHFGLSFAAKRAAPKTSLGILFFATQFVDILWPLLLVLHVEKVTITPGYTETNAYNFLYYPYTHSLLMAFIWGLLVGGVYWLVKKDRQGALIVGLCVASHWFLDLIVHVADLPLTPFGGPKIGLGLWDHLALTLILEIALFLAGSFMYIRTTKPKNRKGSWGLWLLIVLLLAIHLSNTFGPTPPDSPMTVFVASTILMTILVSLAYWVDRNREPLKKA